MAGWLAGCWLLAGILGWGCSQLCLPHGCLLAGAGSWWGKIRTVRSWHRRTGTAVAAWSFLLDSSGPGTATVVCTQPKEGFSCLPGSVGGTMCWAGCPGKVPPLHMRSPPPSLGCHVSWELLAWEWEHIHKYKMYLKCQAGALMGDPSSLTCAVKKANQSSSPGVQHSLSEWFLTMLRRSIPQLVSLKGGPWGLQMLSALS